MKNNKNERQEKHKGKTIQPANCLVSSTEKKSSLTNSPSPHTLYLCVFLSRSWPHYQPHNERGFDFFKEHESKKKQNRKTRSLRVRFQLRKTFFFFFFANLIFDVVDVKDVESRTIFNLLFFFCVTRYSAKVARLFFLFCWPTTGEPITDTHTPNEV